MATAGNDRGRCILAGRTQLGAAAFLVGLVAAISLKAWPSEAPDTWDAKLRRVLAGGCALVATAGLGAITCEL